MTVAVGVDGWRGDPVAVALDVDTRRVVDAQCHEQFASVVTAWPDAVIGVDMPIGYATGTQRRACDVAARAFVVGRRSSVFFVPPEAVLAASTYDEANRRARALGVPGISRQLWALRSKIREVADVVAALGDVGRPRIHEVFPEASFCAMAGAPLSASKRTWAGHEQRRALLAEQGIHVEAGTVTLPGPAPDDVLDAAACAWSATRIARGEAVSLPGGAADDEPRVWY